MKRPPLEPASADIEDMANHIIKLNEHIDYLEERVEKIVPYQACPICKGMGQILQDQLQPPSYLYNLYQVCPTCHGNRIIPMFFELKFHKN